MTKNNDAQEKVNKLGLKLPAIVRTESIFTAEQAQVTFERTPRRFVYSRQGAQGRTFDFVQIGYVKQKLDAMFGFNWDFEIETTLKEAFEVAALTKVCVVKGILTGRCRDQKTGQWVPIRKVQFGRAPVKFLKSNPKQPVDFGNDMKAAATDALKKCASGLGIARDIYDKDDFIEVEVLDAKEHSEKEKNKERLIEEAKQTIEQESKAVGEENGQN